jgi:hypothetical protein
MGTPIASPSDLSTYLGLSQIDNDRATLILKLAQDKCEAILNPLPATAQGVVLDIAGRAFSNPQNVQQENAGPFGVNYGPVAGGLWLTKANRAELRRLGGGSSAFSADTLPPGANAVQTIIVTATAGSYTLYFAGLTTANIAYNATNADIQAALVALPVIGAGGVTVTQGAGTTYTVTFTGILCNTPVPTLIATPVGLTGTVIVNVVTVGKLTPGQGLPPWDYDYYTNRHLLGAPAYGTSSWY